MLSALQSGRPAPAEWFDDARASDTLKWLGLGGQPSRATFYAFRQRVAPYGEGWKEQGRGQALAAGDTEAKRGAQDGTTRAATAARHPRVKPARLEKRLGEADAALAGDEAGRSPARGPVSAAARTVRARPAAEGTLTTGKPPTASV